MKFDKKVAIKILPFVFIGYFADKIGEIYRLSKCILLLRGVRPFMSNKYDLTKHPKYKLTADYNEKTRSMLNILSAENSN